MIWIFVISYYIGSQMGPVALEVYEWWRDPERTYSGPQIQASEMWGAAAQLRNEVRRES